MTSEVFARISSLVVGGLVAGWIARCAPTTRDRLTGWCGVVVVFVVTAALGLSGALSDFSRVPPPMALFVGGLVLFAVLVTLSPWGGRMAGATPLRALVGLQGFRILPEILLALAWHDGVAPVEMTWHGRNADVVTAVTALGLAAVWPRLRDPRAWAAAHTGLGLALLVNVVGTALLLQPPFVTTFPYVWLPGVQVLTALMLHGLTLRKLTQLRRPARPL